MRTDSERQLRDRAWKYYLGVVDSNGRPQDHEYVMPRHLLEELNQSAGKPPDRPFTHIYDLQIVVEAIVGHYGRPKRQE